MRQTKLWLCAACGLLTLTLLANAQQTIYRWLNPETGQYVTTPNLPPYPIKEKRPGANLSGVDFYNVDLDLTTPAVKAAIEKREAAKAEERRKEQERAERQARREQAEKEFHERRRQEAQEAHQAQCTGPLSFGVQIGMNKEQVMFCMQAINNGRPDHVSTTTTAAGLREQWVYPMSGKNWYFYFSNDRLTAVQQ